MRILAVHGFRIIYYTLLSFAVVTAVITASIMVYSSSEQIEADELTGQQTIVYNKEVQKVTPIMQNGEHAYTSGAHKATEQALTELRANLDDLTVQLQPVLPITDATIESLKDAAGKVAFVTEKVTSETAAWEQAEAERIAAEEAARQKAEAEASAAAAAEASAKQAQEEREAEQAQEETSSPAEPVSSRQPDVESPSSSESSLPWYAQRAREQLDALGGSDVEIRWADTVCNVAWAIGCVSYPDTSYMTITPRIADYNYFWSNALIAHEFAHIIIARVDITMRLMDNPTVVANFPGDVNESLADCMAYVAAGTTTKTFMDSCNDTQVSIARTVWSGQKP